MTKRRRPGIDDDNVIEANDLGSDFAVAIAKVWQKLAPGYEWCKAELTSDDGLTLTATAGTQLHFASTSCGYGGSGPHAAASILEIFGFGESTNILNQIRHGGDGTHCSFHHPTHKPEE